MKNYFNKFFLIGVLLLFAYNNTFANRISLFEKSGLNETHDPLSNDFMAENEWNDCNGTQIAYWSLDNCVSFASNGTNLDYSELTATTSNPGGFSTINATNLTANGGHSCVYGQSGAGFCHGIRNNCSWVDDSNDAVRFTVTVQPNNGFEARLTKLSFYESAPSYFEHLSGNSGDNDPPTKYGIRVLKNGQEIYQSIENSTTQNWSFEQFNFTNDPDFTFTGNTTFTFELLGYCRNGSNGLAAWDLDEIKVFGCSESIDPCAGQGGDSDGDGVCNNQDCQPNNPNFPATPGMACNDGNSNTENDMVTNDGCGCAGTPIAPTCSVTTGPCSITITGLDGSDYAKVFDANWNIVWDCNPWGNNVCSATETITNLNNGTYHVQACGTTESYTISGCSNDPCAGQGGDSDGDGVCNNQDCQPNNPNFPATPGTACNDGNPNTENDMVTNDGCGCAGTPTGPSCSVTTGPCSITITGLDGSDYAKVFDANWNIVWDCNPWGNNVCSATETITNLNNGTYHVQACGTTESYTISGCSNDPCAGQGGDSDGDGVCNNDDCQPNNPNFPATPGTACNDGNPNTSNDVVTNDGCGCAGTTTDPCAGQGGDSDGDGVCNNQDCQPNNPNFPATPGTACNDGNPNTSNDMVTNDGCGCAGTPTGPSCSVTTGPCSITITGLDGSDYAKVFDANWNIIWDCNPWGNNVCSATETITNLNNGTYHVQACGTTESYTISGCSNDPCAGQGGDSDGDGVCNNQDCQPNNPNFPATPGTACNDGNSNTENDMVTNDGCGCAGTPTGPSCSVTTGPCSITITGLDGSDYAKVFDANWNIVWDCNPWGNNVCSATETITNLNNGTYHVQACGTTESYTISGCSNDPCAGQGGDSDGDGVCNNQDCQPNNPNFPATPGTACNDGNPNTENDMVTNDGCGCAGTPTGPSCSVTTGPCSITITGLDGSDYAKVFDANWNIVWDCNPWGNNVCSATETITNLNNGTYHVQACGTTESYTISGCSNDPCAGQGGDSDGDGVCNNQDCQPNNPNFPATPGTACNDGNPDTENDVVTNDGCGCTGTPINVCNPSVLAHWDLDNCESFASNGSNNDFSEFTANTNQPAGFELVNASLLTHDDGNHSCVQGQSGAAICSGIRNSCSWTDNSDDAFKFSITVRPTNGGTASLTKFSFYESAPYNFEHLSGNSGDNDPPSKYGIRILKNGQEIYQRTERSTTQNWSFEEFNLSNDPDFEFTSETTFQFELLGYCRQSDNVPGISAWDIDELKIYGCAGSSQNSAYESLGENIFDFQAHKNGRDVRLLWMTNTEVINDYFEVEKSLDGENFELLMALGSTRSNTGAFNYAETDREATYGYNYYRIKKVHLDGTHEYSAVRRILFDVELSETAIFPNPATNELFVNLQDFEGRSTVISIFNHLGQRMEVKVIDVIEEAPIKFDVSKYTGGAYSIYIDMEGTKSFARKFIVAKL